MDIKPIIDEETGAYSINIKDGDIEKTDGLEASIHASLMSDRRSSDETIPPEKRKGWMGDLVQDDTKQRDSLLWQLDTSKLTNANLTESISSGQNALNWFVEDKIAKSLRVTGEIIPREGIRLKVSIESKTGEISDHYVNLWELTK